MTSLNSAIVRIRAPNGTVVGTGFLVTGRHVLTCAHVVTGALGLPHDTPNLPQADLHLDFPLLAPESILTCAGYFAHPLGPARRIGLLSEQVWISTAKAVLTT